jgi:subtilisin family serine protease
MAIRVRTLLVAIWLLAAGSVAAADATAGGTPGAGSHSFVVVTFANNPYRPAARAGSTGRRYTSNSYGIAQLAQRNAERVAHRYALKQIMGWPIRELNVHCVVYEIADARSVDEVLQSLRKDPAITLAQPLQEFRTLTSPTEREEPAHSPATIPYNDPLYGLQANLAALGIPAAHEHARGEGITIALIDTGVDSSHPDLLDRVAGSHSFVSPVAPAANAPTAAFYRHGTAMAGLIAAVANNKVGIVGIAPMSRIEVFEACWQLRANSDAAACNTFTLAQAIAAAMEAGVRLVNMSIAGPADPLLTALVRAGLRRGVIFVGSATDDPDSFPTNIEGVIAARAAGTSRGSGALAAPATHVLTLRPGGDYDFESGTSVAAAQITGVVALMLSADRGLTAASLVRLLSGDGDTGEMTAVAVNAALARLEEAKQTRLARSGR